MYRNERTGYRRKSTITETEDVSYVSSAYVPQCLRYGGRPTLSNAHRAHESGVNTDNIRDELDEVITLNSVSIIVAEYIPFGANQVRTLLGCHLYPFFYCTDVMRRSIDGITLVDQVSGFILQQNWYEILTSYP